MNLAIDIGNTSVKIAIFSKNEIVYKRILENLTISSLKNILKEYISIDKAILSSVSDIDKEVYNFCKERFNYFIELNHKLKFPFTIKYKTPDTLGNDRIAAINGAYFLMPGKNVLIIDIGTAVTYDLLSKSKEYLGGNISPGLNLRYKSLNEHTKKLPLLKISEKQKLVGDTTNNAIISGVQNGLLYEIEGFIMEFSKQYSDLKIVLTGGDLYVFEKKIKRTIFVHSNLVLIGLNRILEYNAKNI